MTEIVPLLGKQPRHAHLRVFPAQPISHATQIRIQATFGHTQSELYFPKFISGSYVLREDSLLSTGVWQSVKRRDVTLSLVRVIYITTHAGE